MFDVNILGAILTTKGGLPQLPETGGSIVNISSAISSLAPLQAST